MRWILSKKLTKVIIESDCSEAVKALKCKTVDRTYAGRIVSDCQAMLRSMPDISFRSVRRDANGWAHRIARNTLAFSGIGEWDDHPPDYIASYMVV